MPIRTLGKIYSMGKEGSIVSTEVLEATKAELQGEISAARQAAMDKGEEVLKHADDHLRPVASQAAKNAADCESLREESKLYTEECTKGLEDKLSELIELNFTELTARLDATDARLDERADALFLDLKQLRLEHNSLVQELRKQGQDMTKQLQTEFNSGLLSQATEQGGKLQTLSDSLDAWTHKIHEEAAQNQKKREQEQYDSIMSNIKKMTAEKITDMAGEVMDEIQEHLVRHDNQISSVETTVTKEVCEHGKKIDIELETIRETSTRRLAILEADSAELMTSVTAAASTSTRSIEWMIPDLLRQLSGTTQSWFSPRFSAAGEVGLQLELQISLRVPLIETLMEVPKQDGGTGVATTKSKKEQRDEKPVFEARVLLWGGSTSASGDTSNIAFRLTLAGLSGPVQENRFERWGPCLAGRMWKLDDRLCRDDGGVRICAEFLSSTASVEVQRRREVIPFSPSSPLTPGLAEKSADSMVLREVTMPSCGTIYAQRQVDNRADDRMKSCMVRRIEWRIEQAGGLKTMFPRGEAVYSTAFSAAGMDGLQLVLYPLGCSSAPTGYCSLFLKCPESMPKCWIHIGKHKMEALQEDFMPGYIGRVKCWHSDKSADSDTDVLNMALEVLEAPCELLHVQASNDPRRFVRKSINNGMEIRPPSHGRPRSSSNKARKRQTPPLSDSTLARGAQTTQWVTQAYSDAAQGFNASHGRTGTPRAQSRGRESAQSGEPAREELRMPPLSPSPGLGAAGMQNLFAASAPITC